MPFSWGPDRPVQSSVPFRLLIALFAMGYLAVAAWSHEQAAAPSNSPQQAAQSRQASLQAETLAGVTAADDSLTGPAAAVAKRKREIVDQSVQLLKMAIELKAEVDKTTSDTLSVGVIRKADAIEQLAREVKDGAKHRGTSR